MSEQREKGCLPVWCPESVLRVSIVYEFSRHDVTLLYSGINRFIHSSPSLFAMGTAFVPDARILRPTGAVSAACRE